MTRTTRLNPRATESDAQASGAGRKIVVMPSGGDYASPKLATDWIVSQNPGPNNQFDVWIYPGIYTEVNWYTAGYTTYRGIGHREQCWLQGSLPNTASDADTTNNSTINTQTTTTLINLKITAQNMRYPVHAEASGADTDTIKNIQNCHLEHLGNQGVVNYRIANSISAGSPWLSCQPYGSGTSSGRQDIFDDSTLIGTTYGSAYFHTNVDFTKPNLNTYNNCRVFTSDPTQPAIYYLPQGSGQDDRLDMNNCEVSGSNYAEENPTPWIATSQTDQISNRSEVKFNYTGTPIGWSTVSPAKALKITSSSFSGTGAGVIGGDAGTSSNTNALVTTQAYVTIPDHTVGASGTLTSVALSIAVSGTVGISVGSIVGTTYTERTRVTAVSLGTGAQVLTPNIAVNSGEVVGIFGTATIYHNGPKTGSNADTILFSSGAVSVAVANWEWLFQITVVPPVSTVRVSGTAATAIFGSPTYKDGGGGLFGYAYGSPDISGVLVGLASNVAVNNTIGTLLGDCSTTSKTLSVTVNGGSAINVVFNTNLTAVSNATIISTINTALGSTATAAEYFVSQGEVYPNFLDRQSTRVNGNAAVGIARWSSVKLVAGKVQPFLTTDPASAFYGVAIDQIIPGGYGRVLTKGFLSSTQLNGAPTITEGVQIFHSDTTPGTFATSGGRLFGLGSTNGYCYFDSTQQSASTTTIPGFTSTVTSSATTTLTALSTTEQAFTGSATQVVKLPSSGVVAGQVFTIINQSTGAVGVQTSTAASIVTLNANQQITAVALVAAPTTAANWSQQVTGSAIPTTAASGSTIALRLVGGSLAATGFVPNLTSTVTSAGTLAMNFASAEVEVFTGTTTHTVTLPTTSNVLAGMRYTFINNSTGSITINASGGALVKTLTAGSTTVATPLIANPTTAAHWYAS
jgi:hypothetical protein